MRYKKIRILGAIFTIVTAIVLLAFVNSSAIKTGGPIHSTDPVEYGQTPLINPKSNPQVESAVEALKTGKYPERLSVMMYSSQPFDISKYRQHPECYLEVAEPGRAFQPAQPCPGVSRLRPHGRPYVEVEQGQSVQLSVKGLPQTPITFTSVDLGIFENDLTTITVESDENGIATATMKATPGTMNDVNIIAASPVTSGQVRFIVRIKAAKRKVIL